MLLAFLMSFGLLGGIAVFADTSGLMYPLSALTVHSWTWHFLLILIGISAGVVYFQRLRSDAKNVLFSRALSEALPLRPFIHAAIFYLCCCALAEIFNLTLDRYGLINMFYINPDLQMQQVVFRDLVPSSATCPLSLSTSLPPLRALFILPGLEPALPAHPQIIAPRGRILFPCDLKEISVRRLPAGINLPATLPFPRFFT